MFKMSEVETKIPANPNFCLDRIAVLEKQVDDLLLLTRHQAATVQALQEESFNKSQRLLELQRAAGKAAISADSGHVLRPKMRLATEVAAASKATAASTIPAQKLHPVDAMQTAEKRLVQLGEERDYWRRHFTLADRRAAALVQELQEFKSAKAQQMSTLPASTGPLKEVDLNATDAESLFVRNLLKENVELKQELARLSGGGNKKTVTIQEVAKESRSAPAVPAYSQQKENRGNQPPAAPLGNSQRSRPTGVPFNGPLRNVRPPPSRQSAGPRPSAPLAVNNRFIRTAATVPTRGHLLPASQFARRGSGGTPGAVTRHFPTTDCWGGGRDCACPACSESSRAMGLETQIHRLTQQNTCLVSQVTKD